MIAQESSYSNRFVRFLSGSPAMRGRPAPDVELVDLNGRKVQLRSVLDAVVDKRLGKQPTILLFSATSCPYSAQEHMEVQNAMEVLNWRAKVVTILVDETPDSAREYVGTNRVPGTVLVDPKAQAARAYKIEMVPTVLMLDTQRRVCEFRHFTSEREVVALMVELRRRQETTGSGSVRTGGG
jgi:peroxiredoxin